MARLYANADFRTALRGDLGLLDREDLTAQERAAAEALDRMMRREVDLFYGRTPSQGVRLRLEALPNRVSQHFDGIQFKACSLFQQRHDLVDQGRLVNAEYMGAILQALAQEDESIPPCLPDVAQYGLALLRASTAPVPRTIELGGLYGSVPARTSRRRSASEVALFAVRS